MKNLAKAIVTAVAFLELSEDDSVNPDDAVRALEDIGAALQQAIPEEVAALDEVLKEEIKKQEEFGCGEQVLTFYRDFLENFGLAR